MKTTILSLSLLLSLFLSSCDKEIFIDLPEEKKNIVIEGTISNTSSVNTIRLSSTVAFSDANSFPAISGAVITISDNLGNSELLTETSPGIYQTAGFTGVPGRTYFLSVKHEGIEYSAQSTMPYPVHLDTIITQKAVLAGYHTLNFIPLFLDPPGKGNYYRFTEQINGRQVNNGLLLSDDLSDGIINTQPIFNLDEQINNGDTIRIEMQCIDRNTYDYFFSKRQTANMQTAAPANPVSNISGGALGYFSANSSHEKIFIHVE